MHKVQSRKFLVWLVWAILSFVSLFISNLPEDIIFQWFGVISMIYIGGNVAQKAIYNKIGTQQQQTKDAAKEKKE